MVDSNSGDDVEDLVSRLQLQGLHYREFSSHKPAVLELAGGRQGPSAVVAAEPAVKPVPIAAVRAVEAPRVSPQEAPVTPKVLATPVNFAFERLRRQAIGPRGDAIVISLHLRPRPAVLPSSQVLLQQPLAEVFSRLARPRGPY